MRSLKLHNDSCKRCSRLVENLRKTHKSFPNYRCLPVPSFGELHSDLLIVGLAPGMHGANATGRPFTGDHAGKLLYSTLYKHGFSNNIESTDAEDNLCLYNCRIANAVKCLPPGNKPTTVEILNCNTYLQMEISLLKSHSLLLALGKVAHDAILRALKIPMTSCKFEHGAEHIFEEGSLILLDSYHCSRYNTQTKRLTTEMFDNVFRRAREVLERRFQ